MKKVYEKEIGYYVLENELGEWCEILDEKPKHDYYEEVTRKNEYNCFNNCFNFENDRH